jgi:predicted small lipoprotein YifL
MKRLALSFIALAMLAGCGVSGGLERPAPLWNREEALARERAQQHQADELAARRAGGAASPVSPSTATQPGGASEPILPPR